MSDLVQYSKQGDTGVITINNPPVNAIGPGVPEGIIAAVEQVEKDAGVNAAVLMGGGSTFIAGADIKEFVKMTSGKIERGDVLNRALAKLENCAKPIVVAIHG